MKSITKITSKYNIDLENIELFGKYIAKISNDNIQKKNKNSKLILVTSISPTKTGEGKTTISINLADSLNKLGKKAIVVLREPSIGPYFGIKGGATGARNSSVIPKNEINLHFTGDMHAITTANNLISAIIDNEIYHNSSLNINPKKIVHARCIDMNDRSLRNISLSIDNKISYKTHFDITAATELMTIFCLSKNKKDFIDRVCNMLVAYDYNDKPIYVKNLNIKKAILSIMDNALKPNVVQTFNGNMALIHGGPFANISIGTASYISIKLAENLADYVITEAGFGADLGAEKFLNILSQENKLKISCFVFVVTIKAILQQGNGDWNEGIKNLETHLLHLQQYDIPLIVCINKFNIDKKIHLNMLISYFKSKKINFCICNGIMQNNNSIQMAKKVSIIAKRNKIPKFLYTPNMCLEDKITAIVKKAYKINKIVYSTKAKKIMSSNSNNNFYVCISKQPNKIANAIIDNKLAISINDININTGSKINIVLCDNVYRMPGLSRIPMAKDKK